MHGVGLLVLYNIARKETCYGSLGFERVPLNISFGRALSGQNLIVWHQLVSSIAHKQLNNTD
jgi:hypothetical protein